MEVEDENVLKARLFHMFRGGKKEQDTTYEKFNMDADADVFANLIESIDSKVKYKGAESKTDNMFNMLMAIEAFGVSPHESEDLVSNLYEGMAFVDDVNRLEPLQRREVIRARMTETAYFKPMGVYEKVKKSEMLANGGEMITTKWAVANKGNNADMNYRSSFFGSEIATNKRLNLLCGYAAIGSYKDVARQVCGGSEGA